MHDLNVNLRTLGIKCLTLTLGRQVRVHTDADVFQNTNEDIQKVKIITDHNQ